MLLAPENDELLGYPHPQGGHAVEAGVAARAHGDQPGTVIDARLAMMYMEPVGGSTGAALVAIALQNPFA